MAKSESKTQSKAKGRSAQGKSRCLQPWSSLSFLRKVWRVVWVCALSIWAYTILVVALYKYVNPPLTPLMVQRFFQQMQEPDRSVRFKRDYVKLEDISPNLITAVIYSEDGLFQYHHGFDVKQLKMSYRENQQGRRTRGGSTISMQTAKNAFLPHKRNVLRKAVEAYFTQLIEWVWGKQRIMEVYLNIIEFGDGIYGCEAASQHYFGKSAKDLTKREAAQLAVCLPNPLRFNPAKHGNYFTRQTGVVQGRINSWGMVDIYKPKEQLSKKYQDQEGIGAFAMWVVKQKLGIDDK